MSPKLAERATRIAVSPTIAVMSEARRLAAAGVDVVDFGPGEPDFPTPEVIAEAGIRAIRDGQTRYTESSGTPELRGAIAEAYNAEYGTDFRPAEVIVGSGGKQPLFNACLSLFEAGDEVLVPAPYWVSYPEMIRLSDARPVIVPTDGADGFALRLEAVEAAWGPKARGIILCSPSNPHGGVVSAGELERIVAFVAARGGTVIFDECYREFVYEGKHVSAAPLAKAYRDAVVVSGSFSKTFAMTGWRVGWLVGPEKLVAAMGRIQSHSTTNASSVSQAAALAALTPEGRAAVRPMIEEYRRRRKVMVEALSSFPGFRCAPPAGAFYVFPGVGGLLGPGKCADSLALSRELLQEEKVATVPGTAFGTDGYLRFSYATSMSIIEEGLRRVRRFAERRAAGNPAV